MTEEIWQQLFLDIFLRLSLCDYGDLKLDFNLLTADCLNKYLEILVPQSMPCTVVSNNLDAGQEATVRTGHGLVPNWERSTSGLYTVTLLI